MFRKISFFSFVVFILFLCIISCSDKKSKSGKKNVSSQSGEQSGNKSTKLTIATFNLKFFGDDDNYNNAEFGDFGKNIRTANEDLLSKISEYIGKADIIGVQEVENKEALKILVKYLNEKYSGRKYKFFMYDKQRSCQDLGIIWDSNKVSGWTGYQIDREFRSIGEENGRKIYFSRVPIYNMFDINNMKIIVMVVHLKAKTDADAQAAGDKRAMECAKIIEWMEYKKEKSSTDNILVIGDFNDIYSKDPNKTDLGPFIEADKEGKLIFLTKNFEMPRFYTNFGNYKGHIFREVIDHIIIPKSIENHYVKDSCKIEMHNSEEISDHNPLYAEFDFSEK